MLFGCTARTEEYELVRRAGFDYAEFHCRDVTAMEPAAFSALERLVERAGLPVRAMNLYCPPEIIIAGPGFDLGNARRYASQAASRAAALGVALMGIGSPKSRSLPEGFDRALGMRQLEEFLLTTADIFGRQGITICLEALGACFCNVLNSFFEAGQVVRRLRHEYLGLILDLYNMEWSGEADADWSEYASLVRHAHTSDDEGDPYLRSYLREEKYSVHLRRIGILAQSGYDRGLTLEMDVPVETPRAAMSLEIMRKAASV